MIFIPIIFFIPLLYTKSEMTVEIEEQEEDALAQLEGEEEVEPELEPEEIYEEGEEIPTDLEDLFPEEAYTVYYQEA